MKHLKRLVIALIAIGSITTATGFYFADFSKQEIVYSTQNLQHGSIENVVLSNGILYPFKMVNVGAQVSGKIEQIAVGLGDELKQGDVIVQIDNLSQQNALKEAQASLNNINAQYRAKQAQIHQSSLEFERQKEMYSKNLGSESAYDVAQAQLLVYQAELDQLVAEKEKALISVDDAELNMGYTTIEAPINGTVVYVSVEEGQTVNTNQSTPSIIEMAQLDVMTVKAQISEADIIHIEPGQQVYFTILGAKDHRFDAVLKAIEPGPTLMNGDDSELNVGDNDAIYYNALFEVENTEKLLRIGMTAQVSIVLESADNALLIPSQVLTQAVGNNHYQVPILSEGKFEQRTVEIGINNKVYAQVLSGLEGNEEVVLGQSSAALQEKGAPSRPGDTAMMRL